MMERKGELTAKQLVGIIILIVSFAIIIIFFAMLNFRGEIDAQTCRNSVMMRNVFGPLGKLAVSYRCKTEEVVITEADSNKIYLELAQLQQDCFWMFGEGEVSLGTDVCAICNIVEFENEVEGAGKINYFNWLTKTTVPNKDITYYEYFYLTKDDFEGIEDIDFVKGERYMIYYIFKTEDTFAASIRPYNSESISDLHCKGFATTF